MTFGEALRAARRRLTEAGVDEAAHDAQRLLEHAFGLSHAQLIARDAEAASAGELTAYQGLIDRRAAREPLTQIIGRAGFWTLDLKVTRDVLSPRADSETIVQTALDSIYDRDAPLEILDIATGSGALALALLSELPQARAVATDLSAAALAVARENAMRTGLSDRIEFSETNWADGVEGAFDLIVSNPPYIPSDTLKTLDPEVKDYEPSLALDGGLDGLRCHHDVIAAAARLLKPSGVAVVEIGYDQGDAIAATVRSNGGLAEVRQDAGRRDRAICFRFPFLGQQ